MSYVVMTPRSVPGYINDDEIYEYKSAAPLSSPSNGPNVLIPGYRWISTLSITLIITAGSGKIQTTTSPIDDVDAGTAKWNDTIDGLVSSTITTELAKCTAVRMVNVTGTTELTITAR